MQAQGKFPDFGFRGISQRIHLHQPLAAQQCQLNSYLAMARNFRDSYPRAGRPLSPRERAFVEQVLERNGAVWNPLTGVIERGGASFYREGRVDQGGVDTSDPDIAFYVSAIAR